VVVNYAGKPAPAQAIVADLKAAGAQGIAVQADVAIAADVERLLKESMDAFGRPDVVVHCARIMPLFLIASGDVAAFDKRPKQRPSLLVANFSALIWRPAAYVFLDPVQGSDSLKGPQSLHSKRAPVAKS
jgi:NAD(P)-dependent dehydrogenase (short-subunit alcohol dehydrogenase family)